MVPPGCSISLNSPEGVPALSAMQVTRPGSGLEDAPTLVSPQAINLASPPSIHPIKTRSVGEFAQSIVPLLEGAWRVLAPAAADALLALPRPMATRLEVEWLLSWLEDAEPARFTAVAASLARLAHESGGVIVPMPSAISRNSAPSTGSCVIRRAYPNADQTGREFRLSRVLSSDKVYKSDTSGCHAAGRKAADSGWVGSQNAGMDNMHGRSPRTTGTESYCPAEGRRQPIAFSTAI